MKKFSLSLLALLFLAGCVTMGSPGNSSESCCEPVADLRVVMQTWEQVATNEIGQGAVEIYMKNPDPADPWQYINILFDPMGSVPKYALMSEDGEICVFIYNPEIGEFVDYYGLWRKDFEKFLKPQGENI